MILSMKSLTQSPKPSARRYRSVKEYLKDGPPIYINHDEVGRNGWVEYENTVKDILKDPKATFWLDGALNQEVSESLYPRRDEQDRGNAGYTARISRLMRKIGRVVMGWSILLWISHITAAFGFVLIANASETNKHPTIEL